MASDPYYQSAATFFLQKCYPQAYHALTYCNTRDTLNRTLLIAVLTGLYTSRQSLPTPLPQLSLPPSKFLDYLLQSPSENDNQAANEEVDDQDEQIMVAVTVSAIKLDQRKWAKKKLKSWLQTHPEAWIAIEAYVLLVLAPDGDEAVRFMDSLEESDKKTELLRRLKDLIRSRTGPVRQKPKTKKRIHSASVTTTLERHPEKPSKSWSAILRSYVATHNLSGLATIGLLFSFISLLLRARNQALMKVLEALSWTAKPGMI